MGESDTMITVLHLITDLDVGGAEMMLYRIASHSDQESFRHVIVSMQDEGKLGMRFKVAGLRVYALGMQRGKPDASGMARLWSIMCQERPSLLQTWLYHADLLGTLMTRLIRKTPLVWNLRNSNLDQVQDRRLTKVTRWLCARLSRLPEAVVVNSERGHLFHARIGYRPRQWVIIPNGFDLQEFAPDSQARALIRKELGLSPDTLLIGLIARYDPSKDHRTFLRAAARLAHIAPNVHFVLAGRGITIQNPALAALIDELKLGGRVHLLGSRPDVACINAAFDIASSTSCTEGFSNVIGEAMACGVPCVVTDVGDSARIVGDTGVVVPAQDPVALANGWQQLIALGSDGQILLGARARQRIEQNYSLEGIVSQYESLYGSVVGA
jgi:glycosyltransferase involved in cell wall biosynthesis